jgi:hypothetical protein
LLQTAVNITDGKQAPLLPCRQIIHGFILPDFASL